MSLEEWLWSYSASKSRIPRLRLSGTLLWGGLPDCRRDENRYDESTAPAMAYEMQARFGRDSASPEGARQVGRRRPQGDNFLGSHDLSKIKVDCSEGILQFGKQGEASQFIEGDEPSRHQIVCRDCLLRVHGEGALKLPGLLGAPQPSHMPLDLPRA
jgi:hypothetical protein